MTETLIDDYRVSPSAALQEIYELAQWAADMVTAARTAQGVPPEVTALIETIAQRPSVQRRLDELTV